MGGINVKSHFILATGAFYITENWGDEINYGEWTGSAAESADRAAHVNSFLILESTVYKAGIILFSVGAIILLMLSIFFILHGYANMSKK